jgi:hypothetical protein
VLITDVRDVVFQADPFDSAVDDRMAVAMENPGIPIGKCPWTGPWVVTAYGEDVLERIGGGPMSCSGTTIAPVRPMMTYLRAMLDQIASMRSADAYLDQAAHNLLLHDGKIGPFERLENFRGPILTVGSEPHYRLDDQDRLVNRDGSVIAVVHQYDRTPSWCGSLGGESGRTRCAGSAPDCSRAQQSECGGCGHAARVED